MLQDALYSLVAPVAVRVLDLTEGLVEREDDLVDCLVCVGRGGLQPPNPSVKVLRERPKHMYVKVVLGGSAVENNGNDEQGAAQSHKREIAHAQQVGGA